MKTESRRLRVKRSTGHSRFNPWKNSCHQMGFVVEGVPEAATCSFKLGMLRSGPGTFCVQSICCTNEHTYEPTAPPRTISLSWVMKASLPYFYFSDWTKDWLGKVCLCWTFLLAGRAMLSSSTSLYYFHLRAFCYVFFSRGSPSPAAPKKKPERSRTFCINAGHILCR